MRSRDPNGELIKTMEDLDAQIADLSYTVEVLTHSIEDLITVIQGALSDKP